MTWWQRALLWAALYLTPGNRLRCGCQWHHSAGLVLAAGCPRHDRRERRTRT